MQTNTDTTKATPELLMALAAAQGEIENASKNAANPHFKSKYADLAEILNTTRPVFAKHGLSLSQFPGFDGALCCVTTLIGHQSGGFIVGVAACVPSKSDAQGIGSATTYLRRYAAAAAAGIAQEDDDGTAAAHGKKPEPFDAAWLDKIAGASDKTELDRINAELKQKFSPVPPQLVSAWKAKAVALAA